jgi:hypothetical protein
MSNTYKTFAVTIRLANGQYITVNVSAVNQVAAASTAAAMGGTVSCIRQLD